MASIVITPLVETWEIANLTNSNSIWFADVPGLNTSGSIPKMVGGDPQWFDALEITSSDILGASDNFRNALVQNPPIVGSRGYKHTHEGLYDTVEAGVALPDATTWHSHSGLDILTAGVTSNADSLHTHDSFITDGEVNVLISSAVDTIDFDDYVRQDGSITQLLDITSDGIIIEAAVAQAHAQGHTLLEHLDDEPVTMDNLIKLFDGSNADCCHTHSNLGGGTFDGEHNELDGLQGGITDEYYHLTEEENNLVSRLGEDSAGLTFDGESIGAGGVLIHNSLVGIQGGATDEYYHLDYDQYLGLVGGPSFYADDLHNHDFPHSADEMPLGNPTDGDWDDGLIVGWDEDTPTSDAIDELNETMSYLAPEDAGSMDGQSMTVSGTSFVSGYLSDGNVNYEGSKPAGTNTSNYIILDATFSVLSPNQSTSFNKADEGILNYSINGALDDTVDMAGSFVEGERSGIQSTTDWDGTITGNLRVTDVRWYNDFPKWQKGIATMDVVSGDLRQGYNFFDLNHDLDTDQDADSYELFYDNYVGAAISFNTGTAIVVNTIQNHYLSGILFYGQNTTFDLTFITINNFKNTYNSNAFTYADNASSAIPAGTISLGSASWDGDISSPPHINDTPVELGNVTPYTITASNASKRSIDYQVTVTCRKPGRGNVSDESTSNGLLLDTYGTTSTVVREYFEDENRRLPDNDGSAWPDNYDSVPGAITGQWTSAIALVDGEAQVFNGGLYYPTIDFTSGYLPSQAGRDYSGFAPGDQVYLRAFYDNGVAHSNGSLEFGNLSGNGDIDPVGTGDINVEIKLPTQTGWLDLGVGFNNATFTAADGDGCRDGNASGNDYPWICGTKSTSDSGFMIIVRVTFRNNGAKYISQIRELGW